jgi:hypothetical protein
MSTMLNYMSGGEDHERENVCDRCYAELKERKGEPDETCPMFDVPMVGCWEQARAITRCQECEDHCKSACKACEFYDEGDGDVPF